MSKHFRVFFSVLLGGLLLCLSGIAVAQKFVEGRHYTLLSLPAPTETPKGMVEVREFFWYGCPHCYSIEPYVEKWKSNAPDNVHFVRTPATLGKNWLVHAYVYYTLLELGKLDTMHSVFFKALHVDKRRLNTKVAAVNFFAEQGLDRKTFENVYGSFSVSTRVKKAERLATRYQVSGVPLLVVDGRYVINNRSLNGPRQIFDLVDYLVGKSSR